jgi:hypothetical protein
MGAVLLEFDKSIVDYPSIQRSPGGASNDNIPDLQHPKNPLPLMDLKHMPQVIPSADEHPGCNRACRLHALLHRGTCLGISLPSCMTASSILPFSRGPPVASDSSQTQVIVVNWQTQD